MKNFNKKFPQHRMDIELQTWIQEKLDQEYFNKFNVSRYIEIVIKLLKK